MDKLVIQVFKNFPFTTSGIQEIQTEEELLNLLSEYVQELIDTDFNKLVNTLYRIDVFENKIKKALETSNPKTANKVIAKLILEREKQKIITREQFESKL